MTDGGRRLRHQAQRLRSHHTSRLLAAGILKGAGFSLALVAVLLLLDRIVPLPAAVRALGFTFAVLAPMVAAGVEGLAWLLFSNYGNLQIESADQICDSFDLAIKNGYISEADAFARVSTRACEIGWQLYQQAQADGKADIIEGLEAIPACEAASL